MGHVWADPLTYSGADEDPTFDDDDEFVFMARHLGDQKPDGFLNPPGTLQGEENEAALEIQDPVAGLATLGYLYVFVSDGSLSPDDAGFLVEYDFKLNKTGPGGTNDYFDAYILNCTDGTNDYTCHDDIFTNPEDTWARTPYYERHFSENW
jgi:hypothetical protein